MRLILFLASIIAVVINASGQVHHFKHEKKDDVSIISSESYVFTFGPSGKAPGVLKERSVNANGHKYKLSLLKTDQGKVEQITDSTGTVAGTILTDDNYTLVLPSGEKYSYKLRGKIWSYTKDNSRYMIGETGYDSEFTVTGIVTDEIAQIAFFERSLYLVISRRFNEQKAAPFVLKVLGK